MLCRTFFRGTELLHAFFTSKKVLSKWVLTMRPLANFESEVKAVMLLGLKKAYDSQQFRWEDCTNVS